MRQLKRGDAELSLIAALDIATGKVTGACKPRHRHQEFLAFLKQVAKAYPDTGDGRNWLFPDEGVVGV